MIKKIQSDAGVKIQFKPGEHDDANGSKLFCSVVHAGTLRAHKHLTSCGGSAVDSFMGRELVVPSAKLPPSFIL